MGKRGHTPEQIIGKPREAEVELAKGKTVGEVCRKLAVTEQTYYRWRKEYWWASDGSGQAAQGTRDRERSAEESGGRPEPGQINSRRGAPGKLLSPRRRRRVVEHVCKRMRISERRACRVLRQPRSTQRPHPKVTDDEKRLVSRMIELATEYGRYGIPANHGIAAP